MLSVAHRFRGLLSLIETVDDAGPRGTQQTVTAWNSMTGKQGGDPAKLATALIHLIGLDQPPVRWAAGADAVSLLEQKAQTLLQQADAYRELSSSLSHQDD